MADNKLNYQQARSVRKAKFSDILLDQLAQSDRGVLGAVGKTISMKAQARIKGIKEKFDPLNIVRFMTMGSRFGPALFGKMTGRNQRDIDYFTGRTKSVVGTRNTADKLKRVGGTGGDSEGINQQLSKIFSFLQNNREEDIKLKQLAKNSEEEIALEKGKRHKELVDTLQKLMKQINSGGVSAEPVKQTSMFDDILSKLNGLADLISIMRGTLLEIAKKLGLKGLEVLSKASKFGLKAATAAAASGGLTVASVAVTGAAITVGATNVLDNMTDEQRDQISADVGSDTALAAQALNSAKSEEELQSYEKSLTKYRKYMDDAPFTTRAAAAYSPAAAGRYLRNEPRVPKSDLDEFENFGIIPPAPTAEPVKKPNVTPQAPAGQEFDAEGNLISSPVQTKPVSKSTIPAAPPAASPVAPAPKSAPVSSLSNTNSDLNLPRPVASTDMKPIINKTVNNLSQKQERTGLRPSQISVRNDEPTFMQLIIDSTRVV
jgi:hypothetical protein